MDSIIIQELALIAYLLNGIGEILWLILIVLFVSMFIK